MDITLSCSSCAAVSLSVHSIARTFHRPGTLLTKSISYSGPLFTVLAVLRIRGSFFATQGVDFNNYKCGMSWLLSTIRSPCGKSLYPDSIHTPVPLPSAFIVNKLSDLSSIARFVTEWAYLRNLKTNWLRQPGRVSRQKPFKLSLPRVSPSLCRYITRDPGPFTADKVDSRSDMSG